MNFLKKPFLALTIFVQVITFSNILAQTKVDTEQINQQIRLSEAARAQKDSAKMFETANKALNLSTKYGDTLYLAKSYFNLASCYYSKKLYLKSIKYNNFAIQYYKNEDSILSISKCYYDKAIAYYRLNNIDSSLHYHLEAYEIRKNDSNKVLLAASANAVGLNYWYLGKLKDASKYYLISLNIRREINDIKGVSMALNALGASYWGEGKFNIAHKYYLEALKIADSTNDTKRYVLVANNIGLIYQEWGEDSLALNYHLSAIRHCENIDYAYGLAYSFVNAGKCYQRLNDNKKALKNFKLALNSYIEAENTIGTAFSLNTLGDFYFSIGNYNKALDYYLQSYNKSKKIGSNHHTALALKGIAKVYFILGKYKLSEKNAKRSIELGKNYKSIIKENYFILSDISEHNKDLAKALDYYKKAYEIKDSIANKKLRNEVLDLQEKYESEKKDSEYKLLLKEQKAKETQLKDRNIIIFIFILGFILLLALVARLSINRKKINIHKNELQISVDALKKANNYRDRIITIIGHDIKGPIATIEEMLNMIHENEIKGDNLTKFISAIHTKIKSTNTLIHDLFEWSRNQQNNIPFNPKNIDLTEHISKTIEIFKEPALKKTIKLEQKNIESILVFTDPKILDTIVRNLLANAIKFTPKNGEITVTTEKVEHLVIVSVTDTGIGIDKGNIDKILSKNEFFTTYSTEGEKGSGLGLNLCIEFIKLSKSELKIESTPGKGSSFSFTLPQKE